MPAIPGAGTPEILAAGGIGAWFDLREYAGRDVPVLIVIAGGGIGALEISFDPAKVKSADVLQLEQYANSAAKALSAPLPNFARIRNIAGQGTVTYMFGRGVNSAGQPCQVVPQSFDTPRTGAFN